MSERISLADKGVLLPTNDEWVDVPGTPFQVRTLDTDCIGSFHLRLNPEMRPMVNHWSCWMWDNDAMS